MEDPDAAEEWDDQEYSSQEESGKLSWIVNMGLSVGMKVLVTGFVISSAPLVLPPLVVISVIGFACSFPSGLFLATYACTDKLMSKLLDYGTQSSDEEAENSRDEEGLKGLIDVGKEEEAMKNDEIDGGKSLEGDEHEQAGFPIQDAQEFGKNINENVEEKEEDAGEIEVKIESIRVEEEKPVSEERWGQRPVDEAHATVIVDIAADEVSGIAIEEEGAPEFAVTNVVIELRQHGDTKEDEELTRETMGLLEKIREEGMTDHGDEEKHSLEKPFGVAKEGDKKVEETCMLSENRNDYGNVRIEKPLREIEPKIDEPKGSLTGSADVVPEERKPIEPIEGLLKKRDGDNILEEEKSEGVRVGTTNASSASKKPKIEKPYVLEEGRATENITHKVQQDDQLNKEKEIVIFKNADAREIADESGLDLYDNKNNNDSQQYLNANRDTEGLYECNGNARSSSQKDLGMASNEVMYNEEKIWQQIDAIRKIVGYRSVEQATYFEELKALYLFTGVEPPASTEDPSDLLEMKNKLQFLMSIVGVKQ